MSERLAFAAKLLRAAGEPGLVVTFRDLPEAITGGDDEAAALAHAADCLEEALAGRISRGESIPLPSRPRRGERLVRPGALIAAKAALHLAMCEARIGHAELAERLGVNESDVRRLLAPRHRSGLDRLDAALAALGKRLVVEARDAA